MQAWLYQMSIKRWRPEDYRVEVWEGKRIVWEVGQISTRGLGEVAAGDRIIFFFAKSANPEPGIYGWGIIHRYMKRRNEIEYQVTPPSDYLKMDPIWDKKLETLLNKIRGGMTQRTLWGLLPEEYASICHTIRERID